MQLIIAGYLNHHPDGYQKHLLMTPEHFTQVWHLAHLGALGIWFCFAAAAM